MNLLDQIMAKSNGKLDPEIKTRDLFSLVKEEEKKTGFHYMLNRLPICTTEPQRPRQRVRLGACFIAVLIDT